MRPKVVLFIVEGQTDIRTLVNGFRLLYRNKRIDDEALMCDVMAAPLHPKSFHDRHGFYPYDSMPSIIRKLVVNHVERADYPWEALDHIVQIIDMDGAYVPDDRITEQSGLDHIEYGTDTIIVPNRSVALTNFQTKRRSIDRMLNATYIQKKRNKTRIRRVPYRLFYMSRNLEHALVGIQGNLAETQKHQLAKIALKTWNTNPANFRLILERLKTRHGNPSDWKTSWDYVREGTHSLERGSNLFFVDDFLNTTHPTESDS